MNRRIRHIAGLGAVIAAAYLAMPYVTLYRLGIAIRDGDAASLETLVDWDHVREGIKEDICDAVFDLPPNETTQATAALPAFGSSFMRTIASNQIDSAVTAHGLVSAMHQRTAAQVAIAPASVAPLAPPKDEQPRITWAFFDSPTTFTVVMQPPGADASPVRIALGLRHGAWKVTRAWMPPEMLMQGDRT